MKLRIVRVVSKETGLTRRYELQRRILPFLWATVTTYSDDGSSGQSTKSRLEHDIAFLLVLDGSLVYGKDVFV